MRNLSDEERTLAHWVWAEAEVRGWPAINGLDFSGHGFKTSWGPGINAWYDTLRAAELTDLRSILAELRSVKLATAAMPVYPRTDRR